MFELRAFVPVYEHLRPRFSQLTIFVNSTEVEFFLSGTHILGPGIGLVCCMDFAGGSNKGWLLLSASATFLNEFKIVSLYIAKWFFLTLFLSDLL